MDRRDEKRLEREFLEATQREMDAGAFSAIPRKVGIRAGQAAEQAMKIEKRAKKYIKNLRSKNIVQLLNPMSYERLQLDMWMMLWEECAEANYAFAAAMPESAVANREMANGIAEESENKKKLAQGLLHSIEEAATKAALAQTGVDGLLALMDTEEEDEDKPSMEDVDSVIQNILTATKKEEEKNAETDDPQAA